ncbi:MAG: hypothetical protein U1E29_18315 [Coriobacteriia bacterium]|nr:hypothetical protein [Coriobacteriia bacterium]
MRVEVIPPGRDAVIPRLTGEPEYSEGAGGYIAATIPCSMPSRHRDRLVDARVLIHPSRGVPWVGRVAQVEDGWLVCTGAQHDISRIPMGARWWCHTATGDWKPRTFSGASTLFRVASSGIRVHVQVQGALATSAFNGAFLRIPTGKPTIVFAWKRHSTDWRITLYWGTFAPGADGHEAGGTGAWTGSEVVCYDGSGNTTGDYSKTVPDSCDLLLVSYIYNGAGTSTPQNGSFTPKVYGVTGVTAITAPNVINHVCDQLPAWILPSGARYRTFIDADTQSIEPFVTGDDALGVMADIVSYRDFDLSFRARMVDGAYFAVPVYAARSTAPSYMCHASQLDGAISGGGISGLADRCVVGYTGVFGAASETVADTSPENYLLNIGQTRTVELGVPTASSATAVLKAQRFLASHRTQRVVGSPTLRQPITDMQGAEVYPCEIEAGRWIRIHGTELGTVDARLTQVSKRGEWEARLTLDDTPTGLDAELALLTKRAGA